MQKRTSLYAIRTILLSIIGTIDVKCLLETSLLPIDGDCHSSCIEKLRIRNARSGPGLASQALAKQRLEALARELGELRLRTIYST